MEKDFYKNIKNTFDNPPEYPYEPAQWDAMKARLHPAAIPAKGVYWKKYVWLLLWVFPFFLVGGYSWYQNKQATQQITALETALQTEIKENRFSQSDTIFNHVVINQYDTIYHTTTVYQQKSESNDLVYDRTLETKQLPQQSINTQKAVIRFDEKINHLFSNQIFAPITTNSLGEIQQSLYGPEIGEETPLRYNEAALKQTLKEMELLVATALEIPLREIHLFRYFEPLIPVYTKEINPLAFTQPTGFNLGIVGGFLKPIKLQGEDEKGLIVGLSTEINFGKRFSMVLGGEYLHLHYKLEGEEHDFSAYPVVEPENVADVFNYLNIKGEYLQIPFGFKYKFRENSRFKPYLGIGAIARKPIKKELNYEFNGAMEEYYVNRSFNKNDFSINTLRGNVGVEYRVYKNWNIYFEGTYDHDFRLGTTDFEKLKYFNLRAGVLYNFKKR